MLEDEAVRRAVEGVRKPMLYKGTGIHKGRAATRDNVLGFFADVPAQSQQPGQVQGLARGSKKGALWGDRGLVRVATGIRAPSNHLKGPKLVGFCQGHLPDFWRYRPRGTEIRTNFKENRSMYVAFEHHGKMVTQIDAVYPSGDN